MCEQDVRAGPVRPATYLLECGQHLGSSRVSESGAMPSRAKRDLMQDMRRNWDEFSSALNCYGAVTAARDSCAPSSGSGGKKVPSLSPSIIAPGSLSVVCSSARVLTTRYGLARSGVRATRASSVDGACCDHVASSLRSPAHCLRRRQTKRKIFAWECAADRRPRECKTHCGPSDTTGAGQRSVRGLRCARPSLWRPQGRVVETVCVFSTPRFCVCFCSKCAEQTGGRWCGRRGEHWGGKASVNKHIENFTPQSSNGRWSVLTLHACDLVQKKPPSLLPPSL